MMNCVDCKDPPGGQACCPEDLTPMCFIRDGKATTHCLDISERVSRDEFLFREYLVKSIIGLAGPKYASEIQDLLSVNFGLAQFSSSDGRIQVTARNSYFGSQRAAF